MNQLNCVFFRENDLKDLNDSLNSFYRMQKQPIQIIDLKINHYTVNRQIYFYAFIHFIPIRNLQIPKMQ